MEKELKLNKLEAKDGVITVVERTGDAEKIFHNTSVNLSGDIKAPGNFIEKRIDQNPALRSHVLFSYRGLFIKLKTNENHELNYTVDGKLILNPDIQKLKINTMERMTVKTLSDLLRFNRFFFSDKDQHSSIISNLQKFRASVQSQIEQETSTRGDKKDLYDVKVNTDLSLNFALQMPVYIGQQPKKFNVEICFDVSDRNISVWLESPELVEITQVDAIKIIDEQLSRFPKEFVIIEQ